jgi:hypothetical protein
MPGSLDLSTRVRSTPEHVACEVGGATVILGVPQAVYYGLDDVGSVIWRLLKNPTTPASIRDTLVTEYDVDPARCERDVLNLVGDLAKHGLVRCDDEPAE